MRISLLVFTAFSLLFSCTEIEYEEKIDGFDIYRIQKGDHGSSSEIRSFEKASLDFMVKFDSSAIYDIGENQSDINKLYGFNDCNQEVYNHTHSARFGWRWMNDSLDLFSYVYENGNLLKNKIKNIQIGTVYNCRLDIKDSTYLFYVDNQILDTVPRGCNELSVTRKFLYPYFGGDVKCPHEITILIKDN